MKIDALRLETSSRLDPKRRAELGQFFTPSLTANFMASLFTDAGLGNSPLILDAGAGIGSLSVALIERIGAITGGGGGAEIHAYEIDESLVKILSRNLEGARSAAAKDGFSLSFEVFPEDYILSSVCRGRKAGGGGGYTHAILNPPYRKIRSSSEHWGAVRSQGVEVTNLYTAFVGLAVGQLADGGELVAIIPRSFCSGSYHKKFRQFLLGGCSISHIHIFHSRSSAFKDDDVLLENIIIKIVKGGVQGGVVVSESTGPKLDDYVCSNYPFEDIVRPGDEEKFIRIPLRGRKYSIEESNKIRFRLNDLGVEVSTGPVVDFRNRDSLRMQITEDCAPMLFPAHCSSYTVTWPRDDIRKPNAMAVKEDTVRNFFRAGCYTVVRRFSAKEDKRRVAASVFCVPSPPYEWIGFENRLNVFHSKKMGLDVDLAYGLMIYLNSTHVDEYFRVFNGHTQVNASDLRAMVYPGLSELKSLGRWAINNVEKIDQNEIDRLVNDLI